MSSLWCHALEPGKPTTFSFTSPLVIKNASLGHSICDTKSRTSVQIRYTEAAGEKTTFLCSLIPGKSEQFSLHVTLDAGVHYIAEIIGKNIVYLIGTYTETDKRPSTSTPKPPMEIRLNVQPPPPSGPTLTLQDITSPENINNPSSEAPTQPILVVEPLAKKKTGRPAASKVNRVAPASRMATRSTTSVGTRSKVASKVTPTTTSEPSGSTVAQPARPIKDVPIHLFQSPLLGTIPTIASLAVEPAPPGGPAAPLSPHKSTLKAAPLGPMDNPTMTLPPMQWANTTVPHPSELIHKSYTLPSSTFSTTLGNFQATTSRTSSSLDVPTPPAHSSLVAPQLTSRDPITDSSSFPMQPTYVCVRDVKVGAGPLLVGPQSTVYVRYRAKVGDTKGPVFAENVNGLPFKFRIGGSEVFPGFSDGVMGMAKGGKRTLFVPPAYGFGTKGGDKVPPNSPLVIECEVLEIE